MNQFKQVISGLPNGYQLSRFFCFDSSLLNIRTIFIFIYCVLAKHTIANIQMAPSGKKFYSFQSIWVNRHRLNRSNLSDTKWKLFTENCCFHGKCWLRSSICEQNFLVMDWIS